MKSNRFRITYEIVNSRSAAQGDAAYRGFLPKSGNVPASRSYMPKTPHGFTLKQAIELLRSHGAHFEADCAPCTVARWVTAYPEDSACDDTCTTLSLHLPRQISDASALRVSRVLAKELRVYGMTA